MGSMAKVERFRAKEHSRGVSGNGAASVAARAEAQLFGAVVRPVEAFLRLEAASGILLLVSAVAALVWANLHSASYGAAFGYRITIAAGDALVNVTVAEFINDGLMT